MCYTSNVEDKYRYWRNWSESLQRIGLQGVAASMLEASAPLNLVLAQLAYLGEPFLPSDNDVKHIFDQIPPERISDAARQFAMKMLELNQKRLLNPEV